MYNFFVNDESISDETIQITGDNYNHIKNVLRMIEGDIIQICNKQTGESFESEIQEINKESILCKVLKKNESTESKIKITVFQGIPKSDKMEYIIQKSVELGAYNIIPVEMKYCIAKINNLEKKLKRWNTISEASAKQSKRNIIPKVENAINIDELCNKLNEYDLVILAYECENENSIKQVLSKSNDVKSIAVIIGPEGGINDIEAEKLKQNGAKSVTLGKRILRTETASSVMLSMIMYELEL